MKRLLLLIPILLILTSCTHPAYKDEVFFGDIYSHGVLLTPGGVSQSDFNTALGLKQDTSEKGDANGYAELDSNGLVPTSQLGTGTADDTVFLRGDQTWATIEMVEGMESLEELDPLWTNSASYLISAGDILNWNSKLSNETDPIVKTINGIVKSDGSTISAATAGTDYLTVSYTLQARAASQSTTTDGQTIYWGSMLVAPSTTADRWRIYIPQTGKIVAAYIYSYSGTAGSAENWSMYIRLNNTSDTLIQTLGVNTKDRVWSNTSLNISVSAGNYIEIKEILPTWATNPATVTRTAVIYIKG